MKLDSLRLPSRRRRLLLLPVAGILVWACADAPTAPRGPALSERTVPPTIANIEEESPPVGTGQLTALARFDTMAVYPTWTVVRISMSGFTNRIWNDPNEVYPPVANDYGINGVIEGGTCKLNSSISWDGGGFLVPTCEYPNTGNKVYNYSRIATVKGALLLHTGTPLNNGGTFCCNSYTVNSTATAEPFPGTLLLSADSTNDATGSTGALADGGALRFWNQQVVFYAKTNVEEGVTMPLVLRKWDFKPDGRVVDSITINSVKNCSLTNWGTQVGRCSVRIRQTGTLTVEALVNGYSQTKSFRVVMPRGFTLTAAPLNSFDREIVRFEAMPEAGATLDSVLSWTWQADVAPGTTTTASCTTPTTSRTCLLQVNEAGWMHVTAKINGHTEQDSVRVTADIPCPQPDSTGFLNRRAVREALAAIWAASNPSGPKTDRLERGAYVFLDSLGNQVFRLSPIMPGDTPCRNANIPSTPMPGIPVAGMHSHPFEIGDTTAFNTCVPNAETIVVNTTGGPSPADYNRANSEGVPHYVITPSRIYQVLPGAPVRTSYNSKGEPVYTLRNWKPWFREYKRNNGSCIIP